jgi:hypothetical protein
MDATDERLNITFPQPCVIFLKSTKNTPQRLTWNVDFFDGQKVTLRVPVTRLADLSVKEIAERDLFPIGQFYLRTFGKVRNQQDCERLYETTTALISELRGAIERKTVPRYVADGMSETIRMTMENVLADSKKEANFTVATGVVETMLWTDYKEYYERLEGRLKRAEAEAEAGARAKAEAREQYIRAAAIVYKAAGRDIVLTSFLDLTAEEREHIARLSAEMPDSPAPGRMSEDKPSVIGQIRQARSAPKPPSKSKTPGKKKNGPEL